MVPGVITLPNSVVLLSVVYKIIGSVVGTKTLYLSSSSIRSLVAFVAMSFG